MRRIFLIPLIILVMSMIPGGARGEAEGTAERIISFYSDITVQDDSSMTVEEIIKVHCANYEINHGIYRDFPTRYRDRYGNNVSVDFRVTRVLRDGEKEPYSVKDLSNGKRIYIGSKEITLTQGDYEYRIFYQTNRQLGFFKDHDELYWNVTGNGWVFAIEQAGARVRLPGNVPRDQIFLEGYTGPYGSKEKNFTSSIDNGFPTFTTTKILGPDEGLTIGVSWPKGYVTAPSSAQQVGYFIKDNWAIVVTLFGLIVLFIYYLYFWIKVGRDPKPEFIMPLDNPPAGLSPAAVRYIKEMGSDNIAFTAAILNMAIKDVINIEEKGDGYILIKTNSAEDLLTPEEVQIYQHVFKGRDQIVVDDKYYGIFQGAQEHFEKSLEDNFGKAFFRKNRKYFGYGVLISLLALLPGIVYMCIFGFSWALFGLTVVYLAVNIFFFILLKAYTIEGRKLMDQIEGFKRYLTEANKDRSNATSDLFEKYLPYALALEVGPEWAKRFSDLFKEPGEDKDPYSPQWYTGSFRHGFSPTHFTQSLGSSFSNAISSASCPPSSSSGSSSSGGGGGFSGGGRGGGGGGGW